MRTNAHPRDQPRPRRVIVVPRLDVTRDQAPWPDEEEEIDPSYSPPSSSGSCSRCDDSDGSDSSENMTDNNSDASASDDDDGECDESPLSSWGTSLECSSDDEEDDESEGDEYDDDEVEYID
jgi:hypothetical protein